MGERIIRAIEWLLLEFEARMITLMIWICWICGITSDQVEQARDQQKGAPRPASMTDNPDNPPASKERML